MSTVNRAAPSDLNPAFRSIPNLAIEPLSAQVAQQAAAAATVSTVCGSVPTAGTNPGPLGAAGAVVKRVVFVPIAAITGQATNFFTLTVFKKTPGVAAVQVATLAFSSAPVTAAAFEQKALTLSALANLTLGPTDSVYVQQIQAGTGLICPAGLVQVDIEPVAPF